LFSLWLSAQSVSTGPRLEYDKKEIAIGRKTAKNPVTLAHALTKGKTTDKEKFDALFAWVATYIKYDFAAYFSSGGSGMPQIKRVLKYRTGICLDYAYLMDSLCKLSGITNTSVYGYAKDEIFDVNDSIYVDNHAWNAVKLDGLWYVYDVTWASGETEYKLTPFSNFIYQLYLKHPPKYKTKKYVSKKFFTVNYCDSALTKTPVVYVYKRQRFWNHWLRHQLLKFRLKTRRFNTQKLNSNYYLCNPQTFAIDHFPDDPAWSLLPARTLREVETDSAFYHLNDSTYASQKRSGTACGDCDGFLASEELSKQHSLRKASLAFNKRNRFITTICEYNIGSLKYNESKTYDDSLTKITTIDTSLSYLDFARASLYASTQHIETDNALQKNKNKIKADLLYEENSVYRDFILKDKYTTKTGIKSLKDLSRKTGMSEKKLIRRINRIKNYDENELPNERVKNTTFKITELNQKLSQNDSIIDLLNKQIASLKEELEKKLALTTINLKQKLADHDSAFLPFQKSAYLRYFIKDNYKKEVVEIRKKIKRSTLEYANGLNDKVYEPAETCNRIGEVLFNAINLRNNYEELSFKLKGELIRRSQLPASALKDYKAYLRNQNRQDICWIKTSTPNLGFLFLLLEDLLKHQKNAGSIIQIENIIESQRLKQVNKELDRRRHKYKKTILNNYRVVYHQTRIVRKEKREFLKKLKQERREAARKTK
jgi:hypothetical protein